MLGAPKLPAETVREINAMGSAVDEAKLAAAISQTDNPPAEVMQFGPMPERAPELVKDSVIRSAELTAQQLEHTAEAIMAEAHEAAQHARQTAQAIREYAKSEADAAFATLSMFREQSRIFREQGERIQLAMSGAAS